jgi:hypothetical protein
MVMLKWDDRLKVCVTAGNNIHFFLLLNFTFYKTQFLDNIEHNHDEILMVSVEPVPSFVPSFPGES